MAITSTATYSNVVAKENFPDTYTPPTLTPLTTPEFSQFTAQIDASLVENADIPTAAAALLTQVQTYFNATFAINTLKLDALATVTGNLTIIDMSRFVNGANILNPGTDVVEVKVSVQYE